MVDSGPIKQNQMWRELSRFDLSEIKTNFSRDSIGLIVSRYGAQDIISAIAINMVHPQSI